MIKTVNYSQEEIIKDICNLYKIDRIHLDPTYSKGVFYKNLKTLDPVEKFDLFPALEKVKKASSENLPFENSSINNVMFDPPFLVGYTTGALTGKMGNRFTGFRYIRDLWEYYENSLKEFSRILKPKGVLIFKCQDTVSSGKQYLSHVHIINEATKQGFYCKDLFVLIAKNRLIGHNHKIQKHARKFHCYFLVFEKVGKNEINL